MDESNRTDSAFARALGDLKRRGCNLLLVGTPSPDAHAAACERLLGDDTAGSRRRLVVLTDGTYDHDHSHAPETRVVRQAVTTRGSGAASTASGSSGTGPAPAVATSREGPSVREVDATDLGTLSLAVAEEVHELEAGVEASDLRVCVDSLLPLVEENDRAEVTRLLHAVTNRVRGARGMAHYHLPVDRECNAVADLEPAFEAVLELRETAGGPEQRWTILDEDLDSGWLAL